MQACTTLDGREEDVPLINDRDAEDAGIVCEADICFLRSLA